MVKSFRAKSSKPARMFQWNAVDTSPDLARGGVKMAWKLSKWLFDIRDNTDGIRVFCRNIYLHLRSIIFSALLRGRSPPSPPLLPPWTLHCFSVPCIAVNLHCVRELRWPPQVNCCLLAIASTLGRRCCSWKVGKNEWGMRGSGRSRAHLSKISLSPTMARAHRSTRHVSKRESCTVVKWFKTEYEYVR